MYSTPYKHDTKHSGFDIIIVNMFLPICIIYGYMVGGFNPQKKKVSWGYYSQRNGKSLYIYTCIYIYAY